MCIFMMVINYKQNCVAGKTFVYPEGHISAGMRRKERTDLCPRNRVCIGHSLRYHYWHWQRARDAV